MSVKTNYVNSRNVARQVFVRNGTLCGREFIAEAIVERKVNYLMHQIQLRVSYKMLPLATSAQKAETYSHVSKCIAYARNVLLTVSQVLN